VLLHARLGTAQAVSLTEQLNGQVTLLSALIRVGRSIWLPRIQVLRLVVSLNLIVIAVAQQNSGLFG
jgi:hypothetical protein